MTSRDIFGTNRFAKDRRSGSGISSGGISSGTSKASGSASDLFDRALAGTLSDEEVNRSASAVVDAAIWSDWSNDLKATENGLSPASGANFLRPPVRPEQRSKLVQSISLHPERTRRLFRS